MKQILTALALCLALSASAQLKLGVTAGVNKTDGIDNNSDFLMFSSRTSFNAGIGLDIQIIDRISFEPVILYSNKGWINTDNLGNDTENNLNYISTQLLAKLHILKSLKIIAGPEFSYLLKASSGDANEPILGIYNEGEIGFVVGTEITLFDRLSFHVKYNFGLNDVLNLNLTDVNGNAIGTSDIKNRAVMIGASYYPFRSNSD